jgi:O-antigen/teichoic acid export membrane protein
LIKKYKKQINNSLIYTLSTIISKAIPFLLLPVFTAYLSKEDYGTLGLIASIFGIASIYIGLRPSLFLIVKSPQMDKNQISEYIYNIFMIGIYGLLLVSAILFILKYIFFQDIASYVFILISLLAFFTIFNEVIETIFQVEKKAIHYTVYQLLKTSISIALALILIIYFEMGWQGKYFADFFIVFCFAFFSYLYLSKKGYVQKKFNINKQKEIVIYLSPLTFHVLGLVMMGSIDRLFLVNMKSLEIAGLYTVAYTMGATIGIVHDALLKVWSPEFYKRIKDASIQTKIKILKFKYIYILGSILMYGVFLLVMPYIFNIMVDEKFHSSYPIIPVVALSLTFEAFRKLFIGYHYNLGKNNRVAFITITAGVINVILNYFLIPTYGMSGAAYATLLSYVIVFIITIIDLNKIENIKWRMR